MHTQAESDRTERHHPASALSAVTGLLLYLLTLAGEAMLGAGVRWLLVYLGAATVGVIVPLGLSAELLAWIAALAPLARSVLGLFWPGRGWIWRRRLGARRPSTEEAMAIGDAQAMLRGVDPSLPEAARRRRLRRLARPGRGPGAVSRRAGAAVRSAPAPPDLQRRRAPAGGPSDRVSAGKSRRRGIEWRFPRSARPDPERLAAAELRDRFARRFEPLWQAAGGLQLAAPAALAERIAEAVSDGRLAPSRARTIAGYLLLSAAGIPQGARRTTYELERECRELGLLASLAADADRRVDVARVLDECMAPEVWK
jgi:hypothetical protein